MTKAKHQKTCDIQKSLETREKFPISYFDSRKYIQHNVALEDGLGPILALMDALPAGLTTVRPLRSFEDGDYSVAHLDYVLGEWGPMIGFEVHRWEEDRIVEHWDNLQSTPAAPNPSGRSMTDGPAEVTDLDRTDANKALVRAFTEEILVGGAFDRMGAFHRGTSLIQHSPSLPDGTEALTAALAAAREGGTGAVYAKLRMLLGQGSLVLAASEGEKTEMGGACRPAAFYDLYRMEGGRIAEHWDVTEFIPPREQWKNSNGKF